MSSKLSNLNVNSPPFYPKFKTKHIKIKRTHNFFSNSELESNFHCHMTKSFSNSRRDLCFPSVKPPEAFSNSRRDLYSPSVKPPESFSNSLDIKALASRKLYPQSVSEVSCNNTLNQQNTNNSIRFSTENKVVPPV